MTKQEYLEQVKKEFVDYLREMQAYRYNMSLEDLESLHGLIENKLSEAYEMGREEEKDESRNWYFVNGDLVITRGKWVINRYPNLEKKHLEN